MSEQTRTPGDDLGADKHRSAPSQPASNPGRVGADHKISVTAAPVQPGGIRHLCLRGGQTAAVDADVFARVSGYSWRLGAGGYVVRTGDDVSGRCGDSQVVGARQTRLVQVVVIDFQLVREARSDPFDNLLRLVVRALVHDVHVEAWILALGNALECLAEGIGTIPGADDD